MKVGIVSQLSPIPTFQRTYKDFNSTKMDHRDNLKDYSGISDQIKTLQPVDQVAEFKFESKFEHLSVMWQSIPKAITHDNRRF